MLDRGVGNKPAIFAEQLKAEPEIHVLAITEKSFIESAYG
jgi:hypothetical protein